MVENFTQTEELETCENETETSIEDSFEDKIREEIKNLIIEPNQDVIDKILQYSNTFSKK